MGILDQVTQQYKLFGATLVDIAISGGNGNQATTLTANLVEDFDRGDSYDPPPIWTPVAIEVEAFKYRGLLHAQWKQGEISGKPAYRVTIADPRDVLDGVQVILGAFNSPVSAIPNVLNAYGYWESELGFGGSLVNDSGMLWNSVVEDLGLTAGDGITLTPGRRVGIRPAVEYLTTHSNAFGGPIQFRGHTFGVDLSGIPTPPDVYRMGGGVARSLLEIVDELCFNLGADYQVVLGDDNIIRFKCVLKTTAPVIGALANWVGSLPPGTAPSTSSGSELANEYTNAVIVGGQVQTLNIIDNSGGGDAIWPYWGVDTNGNAIWGSGVPEEEAHTFVLSCEEVADAVGDVIYPCSIAELRAAAVDFDSWAAYVLCQEPDKGEALGLEGIVDGETDLADVFEDLLLRRDLLATDLDSAVRFGAMNEDDYWSNKVQRIYNFVQQYARDFMGSRFLIKLPTWIYWKAIPETTRYVANEEVSDGGYAPETSRPLGLPFEEVDKFLTDDGRFQCFVAFPIDERMDLSTLDPGSATIADGVLYVRATAERPIFYPNGALPYVAVTLDQPVYSICLDPLGGIDDVAALLNTTPELVATAAGLRHGSFPVRLSPAPLRPTGAAVPTRSNTRTYGPWTVGSGLPGKTYFEQDEDLTPWSYGDAATMEQAAYAKIASTATALQEVETATVKVLTTPDVQIGDALVAGGPSVTGIAINLSTSEISTTYTCQTYTPQFGAFSRYNADRLKRMGIAAQQTRQKIRTLYQQQKAAAQVGHRAWSSRLADASHAIAQRSPHEALVATMAKSTTSGLYRTQVSTAACDELLANIRADDDAIFVNSAGMGLEGLLRPYSTRTTPVEAEEGEDPPPDSGMPHFEAAADEVPTDRKMPITRDLSPVKDSDVDLIVSGQTYGGNLHRKKGDPDYDDARPIGLKGPVAIVGWGFEQTGKPVPNPAEDVEGDDPVPDVQDWDDDWIEDKELHPEKFKAGALGVAWCKWTKTWRQPSLLLGKNADAISDGSTGVMKIWINNAETDDEVDVVNWYGADIAAGSSLGAMYYALDGRYYIMAAQCPAS